MKVFFGFDGMAYQSGSYDPVAWDPAQTINPHMLLVGTSGAGKTFTLRKIVNEAVASARENNERVPRFHVMDVHGDLGVEGGSSLTLSGHHNHGINPLVIDTDPYEGGVRKRVHSIIDAINHTSRQLGERQENVLRHLIYDLYARKGFYPDQPESWKEGGKTPSGKPKTFPNLSELYQFIKMRIDELKFADNFQGIAALHKINKTAQRFYSASDMARQNDTQENLEELERVAGQLKEAFMLRVDMVVSGEVDFGNQDLRDKDEGGKVAASVYNRISNLMASGIFKDSGLPFDEEAPVWRYDIKPLSDDEQKLFIHFRLEEIMRRAMAQGATDEIRDIIVIDEAHKFMSKEGSNLINRIAKEGRKFGVAVIAASQSPKHFSEDFLSLVAAKIVLKLDESFWAYMNTKMRVPIATLRSIVTGRLIVVQIKHGSAQSGHEDFRYVLLADASKASKVAAIAPRRAANALV